MLRLDFLARDACAHRARLRERGLAQHEQAFRKNNIVPEILPKLTAEWRADVLARINDHPARHLADVLPWNWHTRPFPPPSDPRPSKAPRCGCTRRSARRATGNPAARSDSPSRDMTEEGLKEPSSLADRDRNRYS